MSRPERNSVEARLATLRFGVLAITSISIAALLALAILIYIGADFVSDETEAEYSIGDYLGTVGPLMTLLIVVIIAVSAGLYFGYGAYLRRQAGDDS